MNFGEITDAAIAQVVGLGQVDRLVNTNTAFVKAMVNKGYHIVERTSLWKFSEKEAAINTASGTRVCADTPDDLAVPLMVYCPRISAPLEYHDERQRFYSAEDSGPVRAYAMWANELRFYPLPTKDESLTLRYYYQWPDLVADSDEPVFPATFHDLLVDYGSYHLVLRLPPTGDRYLPYSSAQPYLEGFKSGLGEMLSSDLAMKTFDEVPNYDFNEGILGMMEW